MALSTEAYVLAKSYTVKSLIGAGALKGEKGDEGASVTNMEIDANGHLITYYSNGTFSDAGEIPTVSTEVETLVEEKIQEQIETQLDTTIQEKVNQAVEDALSDSSSSDDNNDEIDSWFQ